MNEVIGRVVGFEKQVFPNQSALYSTLATHGQSPKALMISCADSRVVPEHIIQAQPGDLFVCRNAGNIVPPFSTQNGGVSSTVEYAVAALGVRDIIVCGHSDCGAMKALMNPEMLEGMPNVAAWLRHSHAAESVVKGGYPEMENGDAVRAASLENVVAQLAHLRTHPSVAAAISRGDVALHGWFVDIKAGVVLGLDGVSGRFVPMRDDRPLPVALPAAKRIASENHALEAAE
ncbi:carbonic anhydrase [Sphingomonas sp. IC-56]|uniref:carbonic anhydrase n=1 Tax=Sphingomonas sp. IC-56 TaxID=2898529 RepID=UPI001E619765|nr:carbonic anhydrase [Sphingomonas sp. IC-56]